MALFDDHPLTEFDRKAHSVLGDKVVVKSLAQEAALQRLPRYVSEYLIAKYVKAEILERTTSPRFRPRSRNCFQIWSIANFSKEKLLSRGEVTLIDNVEATNRPQGRSALGSHSGDRR